MSSYFRVVNLECTGYIVGTFDMLMGFASALWFGILSTNKINLKTKIFSAWTDVEYRSMWYISSTLFYLLACCAYFLIYGTALYYSEYIWPWMVVNAVSGIYMVVELFLFAFVFQIYGFVIAFVLTNLVLRIVFGTLIWKLYRKIFQEEFPDPAG